MEPSGLVGARLVRAGVLVIRWASILRAITATIPTIKVVVGTMRRGAGFTFAVVFLPSMLIAFVVGRLAEMYVEFIAAVADAIDGGC